jgi:flagellar hook protein FlgE
MFDLYKGIKNSVGGLNSALRIAIANADNFNTPGYKYTFASFTTVYSAILSSGTDKLNPVQFPGSMTLGSTSTDFSQGNITFGTGMDAAVVGKGFFVFSHSASDNSDGDKVYSRAGRFQVDSANQYVTDSFGRKVYGYKVDVNGNITDRSLVPIQTNSETDVGIIDDGYFVGNYQKHKDDITNKVASPTAYKKMFKLALATVPNEQGLILTDGSAYQTTAASGAPLDAGAANEGIYGAIKGASLESANVDVSKVALDLALLNRGFSAIQGVIDDVNKVLSGLISKLQ